MKKNKYLIAFLIVALVVTMFAGCKRNTNNAAIGDNSTIGGIGDSVATDESKETMSATEAEDMPEEVGTLPTEGEVEYEEPEFVPSVEYKGGPGVVTAMMSNRDVTSCVIVSSLEEAIEKTTDITQEERDELIEVYNQLVDGTMVLPIEGDYVIRDYVDVSFLHEGCRKIDDHEQKDEELADKNVTMTVKMDFYASANEKFMVMAYVDGEWVEVLSENNGDGTINCEFTDICPVVFVILK